MADIRFCENNFSHPGVEDLVDKLEGEFRDHTIEVEPCLGYCGDCANSPYALVDDEMVGAETADELYENIKKKLNKE